MPSPPSFSIMLFVLPHPGSEGEPAQTVAGCRQWSRCCVQRVSAVWKPTSGWMDHRHNSQCKSFRGTLLGLRTVGTHFRSFFLDQNGIKFGLTRYVDRKIVITNLYIKDTKCICSANRWLTLSRLKTWNMTWYDLNIYIGHISYVCYITAAESIYIWTLLQ